MGRAIVGAGLADAVRHRLAPLDGTPSWSLARKLLAPASRPNQGAELPIRASAILDWSADEDALERAAEAAFQECTLGEDSEVYRLLEAKARDVFRVESRHLDLGHFEELKRRVPNPGALLINRQEISDLVRLSLHVDPETRRDWMLAGWLGRLLGVPVLVCASGCVEVIPPGEVYVVSAPERLGSISIRNGDGEDRGLTVRALPPRKEAVFFELEELVSMALGDSPCVTHLRKV